MRFNKGDYVEYPGNSVYRRGIIDGPHEKHRQAVWVLWEPNNTRLWASENYLTLIRGANEMTSNDNKEIAKQLRLEAQYLRAHEHHSSAAVIETQANKLDPKPTVKVSHLTFEPEKLRVEFDNKSDASAVSHFLYRASHLVDEVYKSEPNKQAIVRAYIDGWHNRTGK
jgi:hypothetical protein